VSFKKILFAALLAAAGMAMSSTSMAQFDGLYIGGGFARFTAVETAIDSVSNSSITFGGDRHQGGFNVNAGLGGSVGPIHLAAEVSYSNQIGEINVRIMGVDVIDGLEEAAAVSLLPGIKFGNTGLLYARIGATQAKLKGADGSFTQKHDGVLFGVGTKLALGSNGAIVVEYQNYDMKEKEGIQPRATGVLIGLQFSLF
jgi:outer membrane protein with beta-barrel domain